MEKKTTMFIIVALVTGLAVGSGAVYVGYLTPLRSLYETVIDEALTEHAELIIAYNELGDKFDEQSVDLENAIGSALSLKEANESLDGMNTDILTELGVLEDEARAHALARTMLENETDELNSQLDALSEYAQNLETQLSEKLDPGSSPSSYRGRLDTWYHYRKTDTEEEDPQYDAKVIDGSWSLVESSDGEFSLLMSWTELNINKKVEEAPPGTYDGFIVTLTTRNIDIVEDTLILYGDAHWRKTHWDGKFGAWSRKAQIEIMPNNYLNQFRYIQRLGAFNELLIYGSFYP